MYKRFMVKVLSCNDALDPEWLKLIAAQKGVIEVVDRQEEFWFTVAEDYDKNPNGPFRVIEKRFCQELAA